MKLLDELQNLTGALNAQGIDYALCGGLAMAVWGMPRATLDIDLLIEPDSLVRVSEIARQIGFGMSASPMHFKGGMVQIHRLTKIDSSKHAVVLDMILVTDATRAAWESRRNVPSSGGNIKIVSPTGLVSLKSLRNSLQDQQDIEYLRSITNENRYES
ncbi:nucleotidyltransferase family protein [bacterium]|nr:nucleotidyltransferase family protein [bacterium]